MELEYTEEGNVVGIRVTNEVTNAIVTGQIVLSVTDRKYCCTLKELKKEKKNISVEAE